MNILFYRYGSICEPDILDVFNRMNFTVYEDTKEITHKSLSDAQKLESLSSVLYSNPVDFVFSINFFPFLSEVCERLHIMYVCWSVDCPVLELFSASVSNKCNRIFLFDYKQYERIHPMNPDCIFYLPLATNVSGWDKIIGAMTDEDRKKYSCDISFVGSLYHEKSPMTILNETSPLSEYWTGYVKGLVESQLQIYGYNLLEDAIPDELVAHIREAFPDFYKLPNSYVNTDRYVAANYYLGMQASETERIRILNELGGMFPVSVYTRSNTLLLKNVTCKGGVTTHTQMPMVFNCSKINLNITIKPIQSGLSLRVWDVLGCGGFLLSNYQSEIPEYFKIGTDLDCYESIGDLKRKVDFYLKHDDIRKEIAHNGYEKVKAMHTYEVRIASIVKILFNL